MFTKKKIILISLISCFLLVFYIERHNIKKLNQLQLTIAHQEKMNYQLKKELITLRTKIWKLAQDPKTIENAIRKELGLVKKNDVLFIFEDSKNNNRLKDK